MKKIIAKIIIVVCMLNMVVFNINTVQASGLGNVFSGGDSFILAGKNGNAKVDKDKLQFGDELCFKLSEIKSYSSKDLDNQEIINKMVNLLDADYLSVKNDIKDISIQADNIIFKLKLVNGLWYSDFINELKREFEI